MTLGVVIVKQHYFTHLELADMCNHVCEERVTGYVKRNTKTLERERERERERA